MSTSRANLSAIGRQRIGAFAMMATGVVFIWRSLAELPLGTIDDPGPAAMPLLLAAVLVLFTVWSLIAGRAGLVAAEEDDAAEPGSLAHAARVIVAMVVAALALDPLGYRLTILAVLLFFLGLVERKPIVTVLIVSFALSFGSHALFQHVLKVPLPAGPWGL